MTYILAENARKGNGKKLGIRNEELGIEENIDATRGN